VGGHIHDEYMADSPRRAQADLARGDRAHELIGVQAAFHQQLARPLANELDRLCRRRLAVRRVDDPEAADLEAVLAGDGGNLRVRADEDRHDDAGLRRLGHTAQ
jgi:hypothetical protein